ncbi:MAG: hypothetical protein PHE17_19700 [Thiothrix sp.]|uniref:hypothetical protein n=1 Tax=Thiothrix sp. TaxID=1032 RepID=UPI00263831CC|nr:hypothetical protein [Thiothrix sp.]MDD5395253.1 hypothetical protein [Thiothrix sp.]
MSIPLLLSAAIPGSKRTISDHIKRGGRIAAAIQQRYQISNPHQWQAKHLRWFLEVQTAGMPTASRYDYWRTCRALASALGKWPAWETHVRGNWNPHASKQRGGRPAKLANRGISNPASR